MVCKIKDLHQILFFILFFFLFTHITSMLIMCRFWMTSLVLKGNRVGKDEIKTSSSKCVESNLSFIFFFYFIYFFYLWWILSYIEMKQLRVYMCSPSQSPLPPPSPPIPSRFSQCTRSEHLSHASNLGWWSVLP